MGWALLVQLMSGTSEPVPPEARLQVRWMYCPVACFSLSRLIERDEGSKVKKNL